MMSKEDRHLIAWKMLALTLLLFSALRSSAASPIKIIQINGTLLQETLGKVHMYSETWKIFHAVDLAPLKRQYNSLYNKIVELASIGEKYTTKLQVWTGPQVHITHGILAHMKNRLESLSDNQKSLWITLGQELDDTIIPDGLIPPKETHEEEVKLLWNKQFKPLTGIHKIYQEFPDAKEQAYILGSCLTQPDLFILTDVLQSNKSLFCTEIWDKENLSSYVNTMECVIFFVSKWEKENGYRVGTLSNLYRKPEGPLNNDCYEDSEVFERYMRLLKGQATRKKRGLFNVIGSFHKLLYGTLDAEDGRIINENIASLINATNTLNSVLIQSNRVFHMEINSLDKNQQVLKEELEEAFDTLKDLQAAFNHTQAYNMFNQVCTLTLFELNDLETSTRKLMDAVQSGKHGIIDPSIFRPRDLVNMLTSFQTPGKKHYFAINEDSYQNFIDISQVTVASYPSHLVYVITVPYIDDRPWTLIQNTPIPTKINGIDTTVIPTFEFRLERDGSVRGIEFTDIKQDGPVFIAQYRGNEHKIDSIELCEEMKNPISKNCLISTFETKDLTYMRTKSSQVVIPPPAGITISWYCQGVPSSEKSHDILKLTAPSIVSADRICSLQTTKTKVHLIHEVVKTQFVELQVFNISTIPPIVAVETVTLSHKINLEILKDQGKTIEELETILRNNDVIQKFNTGWFGIEGFSWGSIFTGFGSIGLILALVAILGAGYKFKIFTGIMTLLCKKKANSRGNSDLRIDSGYRAKEEYVSFKPEEIRYLIEEEISSKLPTYLRTFLRGKSWSRLQEDLRLSVETPFTQ